MKIKLVSLILIVMGISFIFPRFPHFSVALARGIDMLHLMLLGVLLLAICFKSRRNVPTSNIIILMLLYSVCIIIGNINGMMLGFFSLRDLGDLYRPALWIISIYLGAYLAMYDKDKLFKLIQIVSVFSLFVAVFQKMGFNFLYHLYAGGHHIVSNRTTGIAQDFADYSFIQALGASVFFYKFRENRKSFDLLMVFILCFSVLLSTSKAGLALIGGMLIYFASSLFVDKKVSLGYKLLIIISFVACIIVGYRYVAGNESFYREVTMLLVRDESLPSISERQDNHRFVNYMIFENISIGTLIGYGGSSLIDDAYIEVAVLTVLYRTGLLGLVVYYLIFTAVLFRLYKEKELRVFMILVLGAVIIDMFAAMTNRLLGINMLFLIYGYAINKKQIDNENIIYINRSVV